MVNYLTRNIRGTLYKWPLGTDGKPLLCGIYSIKNKINGKIYIGSSVRLIKRFNDHQARLDSGNHLNKHLQTSWDKYGSGSFEFLVILYCEKADIVQYEQVLIDYFKASQSKFGYNKRKDATNNYGVDRKSCPSSKVISEKIKKLWEDPEYRNHMVNVHKKNPNNDIKPYRKKIGAPLCTEEKKKQISEKISSKLRGRKFTEEHKRNMRGRKCSPESLVKMSVARTEYWKKRREDNEFPNKKS